jgi:membrane-bound serine protease (ClpP class)
MTARLILAIVSTSLEEAALFVIWRWGLPQVGVYLPLWVLIVAMVVWAIYASISFWIGTRALGRKEMVGLATMIGGTGRVVSPLAPEGQVRIKGELWGARAIDGNVDVGEEVTVVGQDGLKLIVRKASGG